MTALSAPPQLGPPPGPRLSPSLQTALFILAPRRFIERSWRRYGDVVRFSTRFDSRFVLVFHPREIKEVFTASPDVLRAGEANAVLGPVVGQRSVLLLDGAEHLRQRRLMLPPFHGRRLHAYERQVLAATDAAVNRWPIGRPFALLAEMQQITLDVIAGAVFGIEEAARAAELKRRLRAMLEPLSNRLGLLALMLSGGRFGNGNAMRRFEESRAAVDELVYEEIARRRAATDLEARDDVFSLLLSARDDEGEGLCDSELRDELITLLVAGHETTATGLAWAFELLGRNPQVRARLREAQDEADAAEYADAVVKEALRLRPVIAGVGRKVRGGPFELGGYRLEPGTEINPSIALVHRRADLYPEREVFRPERFLDPDDAPDMRTVVQRVLARTELRPARRRPEAVLRRGITQVPEHGARVVQAGPPQPQPQAYLAALRD